MKKILARGFTLVELLIVIGLLGAIALIVISAINPIEQANRARDTRFKADAGQLISAIDRYYAVKTEFPWMTVDPNLATDDAFDFSSATVEGVGICGATCDEDGILISNDELKTEFRNRDFIQDANGLDEQIMVGKEDGSSASIYACFIPLSKSIREKSCADGNVYTLSNGGVRTEVTDLASCASDSPSWDSQYVCIPE